MTDLFRKGILKKMSGDVIASFSAMYFGKYLILRNIMVLK